MLISFFRPNARPSNLTTIRKTSNYHLQFKMISVTFAAYPAAPRAKIAGK